MKSALIAGIATFILGIAALPCMAMAPAHAEPAIGAPAPTITAKDITGADVSLDTYKGKTVVLEWTNNQCPFVRKHYDSKNMQNLQKYAAEKGVVWISIVSSAPEKQGHTTAEQAAQILKDEGATVTHKILDETGTIGKLYGAKTTPNMFVIAPDGTLAYKGAIDDNSSPRPSTIEGAKNYVRAAIDEIAAGKPVTTPQTEPYGCGVKY